MATDKYGFKRASNQKGGLVYRFFSDLAEKGDGIFQRDVELIQQNKTSFAFKDCPGTVFGLSSPSFCNAFHEVTSGEGSEKDKINTLHSSSLLGLLSFYKMKEPGSHINIKIGDINFSFDKIIFEKTNKVFSPSVGLSSIDMALYGTANGGSCVLYLESKFSEFLHRGDCVSSDKAKQYQKYYEVILRDSAIDISHSYDDKRGKMIVSSKSGKHYCEGIKQMVSHYIGALNSEDRVQRDIYLAPIIFDFSDSGLESAEAFARDGSVKDYVDLYPTLANELNSKYTELDAINPKNFKRGNKAVIAIDKVLTYQSLFRDIDGIQLDSVVKSYYNL